MEREGIEKKDNDERRCDCGIPDGDFMCELFCITPEYRGMVCFICSFFSRPL